MKAPNKSLNFKGDIMQNVALLAQWPKKPTIYVWKLSFYFSNTHMAMFFTHLKDSTVMVLTETGAVMCSLNRRILWPF
jgi:hypothetical protein